MGARLESGRFAQPDPIRVEVESLLAAAKTASRTGDESLALRNCLNANLKAGRADRSDLKERALRAATTLAPDHPRGHFGLGRFLEEQGRHSDALASLQKAQELQPAWPPALQATVELALRLEQPQVARKALDRTEQDPNTSPTLMLQVGELYEQVLNDRTAARRVYESWTRRFPQDARLPEVEARL
jgi:tetratricopeptide (TPR) repeat protein